jgi:hypothetical protein
MNVCRFSLGVFLTLLSSASCGPPDSAVELDQMSVKDLEQYCKDKDELIDLTFSITNEWRIACARHGVDAAAGAGSGLEAQATCHEAEDDCLRDMSQPPPTPPSPLTAGPGCEAFAANAKTCKGLTVGEFDDYVDEQISDLRKMTEPQFCGSLTVEVDQNGSRVVPLGLNGAMQKVVKEKCPALLFEP